MERIPYRDPDRAFGQAMLTLRDALGLTQAALAVHLGVSRRTVGDWEAGNKHPKAEHLKEFIALGVRHSAFAAGREAEQIHALWRAAHQRVLLDEAWLTSLLGQRASSTGSRPLAGTGVDSVPPVTVPAPSFPSTPTPSGQREIALAIATETPVVASPTPAQAEPVEKAGYSERTPYAPGAPSPAAARAEHPDGAPASLAFGNDASLAFGNDASLAFGNDASLMPRVDWGSAPSASTFYGRGWEMSLLTEWVVKERCRVVSVLGLGGIGKSSLAVALMHRIAEEFEVVIWRSLRDLATSDALLHDLLQTLTVPGMGTEAKVHEPGKEWRAGARTGFEQDLSALLERFRHLRVLLVLDNVESVLAEGSERSDSTGHTGQMRPGYEGIGRFLQRVAETQHQSCVLLTSREKPGDLVPQEGSHSPVRALRVGRLDGEACETLLVDRGVKGTAAELARLIEAYAGNPLALIIVSRTIVDLFDGDLSLFLEQGETIYGGVRQLLSEQFSRLSELELSLLTWLAIMREPTTFDRLRSMLVTPFPPGEVLDAVEGLHRHNLIERGPEPGSFTLQSVIMEYVTAVLLSEASDEIRNGRLDRLVKHGLELADAKDYVRETQERVLVAPLLERLQAMSPGHSSLEAELIALLDRLRSLPEDVQGYGPANLLALLRRQRGDLHGLDLSRLALRSVNLQDVQMQGTSLAEASIRDSVFRETFDVLTALAVSKSGQYWAAAGRRGIVRVWDTKTGANATPWALTLRSMWQAHTDRVWALAFSPDERTLVSGSWDGALKVWDPATGDLLWSGWHASYINAVAFAPDGSMLASCGSDGTVRLWDTGSPPGRRSGAPIQVLPHPGPVLSVAWSQEILGTGPEGKAEVLLASGDREGTIRLWAIRGDEPAGPVTPVRTLKGHSNWVWGLAFSPHSSTLASASWDDSVKLWDTGSPQRASARRASAPGRRDGHLSKTLTGHKDWMSRLVWSSDGRTLAGAGRDSRIWLWDADEGRSVASLAPLSGQTPGIWGLAFAPGNSPGSQSLVSSGEDGTLRVWDISSAKCVRVIQGFTSSLYDLDWSPDGTKLVIGGSNASLMVWDIGGEAPPKVFFGHRVAVFGVAWSPDWSWIASSEWDNSIRLWNPNGGEPVQIRHRPDESDNFFYGLSWSPDGQRLACGTYTHGIQVFELSQILAGSATHSGHQLPAWIRRVGWSPDGTRLAGGGDDGTVYVWDTADNSLLRRLAGHHGAVKTLAWSPDSALLASAGGLGDGGGGELRVWDMANPLPEGRQHAGRQHAGPQSGGRLDLSANHPAIVYSIAWGSDQNTLVSGDGIGMLRWWDVRTGESVRVRQAHEGTIQALKRSPDGTRLASCGDDGAIMLWDLQTGEHLRTLRRDRPYERLNITGVRGLTEAQKATLRALGAIED
jgi:WD40 repeat protein/transcriptional regulator with XRE-family HTH domain